MSGLLVGVWLGSPCPG